MRTHLLKIRIEGISFGHFEGRTENSRYFLVSFLLFIVDGEHEDSESGIYMFISNHRFYISRYSSAVIE